MVREARTIGNGLAIAGTATIGRLSLSTPMLAEAVTAGDGPTPADGGRMIVRALESASIAARRLALEQDGTTVELTFPVLRPQITGAESALVEVAAGVGYAHGPLNTEALSRLAERPMELIVLGNARALWESGRPFLQAVGEIRRAAGPEPLLWTPRVALPHRLPWLAYLGVDLMDTTEGRGLASEGRYLDAALGVLDGRPVGGECRCPGCAEEATPAALDRHAVYEYRTALRETQRAIAADRLRELVEARLPSEPALGEALRHADRDLADLLDETAPVVAREAHSYVVAEAHRRPEMRRFRRRLRERYRPPASKRVLVLVPCSRTKPYRLSPSHRRFRRAVQGLDGIERLHFVSVSSPIGVVPAELEDVPPARHYDIPVTGEWTREEQEYVLDGLDHLLRHGAYSAIVVHLDPREYGFLVPLFAPPRTATWTATDGHEGSDASLDELRRAAAQALAAASAEPIAPLAVVKEELREVAAIQFGRDAAERLFAGPLRLAGRPWFQRLVEPGQGEIATWREERGLFHLTVRGAERLGRPAPLEVEVGADVPLTGDLFVPGVRRADPAIRIGDAVVLVRGDELLGVGEAALPGRWMTRLRRGLAVRVRHRRRAPSDTAMTDGASVLRDGPVV